MAGAHKPINLGVSVLTRINHGLNTLANYPITTSSDACFLMHYVYCWLSYYFDTYIPLPKKKEVSGPLMVHFSGKEGKTFTKQSTWEWIQDKIMYGANSFSKNRSLTHLNDGTLYNYHYANFISICSCYMSICCENGIIFKPYSPHRFPR